LLLRIKWMEQDTLYYDGACPLCSAEINKLSRLSGEGLCLRNIHELDPEEDCPAPEVLMARLHLKTAEGQWITGLSANVHAWQHTRLGFLWRVLELPLIRPISHYCYELWLRQRNR